jgi:acyl-coenzyme A synthetase/AMP-(fatty) acid ligase
LGRTRQSLCLDVLRRARDHPERAALVHDGAMFSYADVAGVAAAWAQAIRTAAPDDRHLVVAVLAGSTPVAYLGSLAAQLAGGVFVPVDPGLPDELIRDRLEAVGARLLAVDVRDRHRAVLGHRMGVPVLLWDEQRPGPGAELDLARLWRRRADLLYILFTSGSTGRAKPTPITIAGARAAVAHTRAAVAVTADDRLVQTFPVGFDLNILTTYLAWSSGAALVVPVRPARAQDVVHACVAASCTVWFSVPSLARLVPDGVVLPGLRASLFCGEALYRGDLDRWRRIAPNGSVHNFYGPTECAMVATHYRCPDDETGSGVLPIGTPLPGVRAAVDPNGELLLGGAQLMPGYWRRPAETRRAMRRRGRERLYRTGDLVSRGPDGELHFAGRLDDQVKVMGHRIELQAVTLALLDVAGVDEAAAFVVPDETTRCERLVAAYTSQRGIEPAQLQTQLSRRCPPWMVPWPLVRVQDLPRNGNGKTSVAELRRRYAEAVSA